MPRIQEPPPDPICVRHREGWCATRKKTTSYADSIKTVCGHYVVLPWQIEPGIPDCPDCLRILGMSKR